MEIIAELCQNHNGDFELLKDMVYSAHESGADYIKIQTIFAEMLSNRERFENGITENGVVKTIKRPYSDEYTRLKTLEISYEKQAEFIDLCKSLGVKPMTTAFNRISIPKIKEIGFDYIKVASYDCGSIPLISDLKNNFKKIVVSTGASYDQEIKDAANILEGADFSLLHCVTIYPTPLNHFHLSRMKYLKQFSDNVGWSDHSLVRKDGVLGTLAAIYYGATIIERHFTILDENLTKDGPVSITSKHIEDMKKFSLLSKNDQKLYLDDHFSDHHITLGNSNRELSDLELLNRDYYRGRFTNHYSKDYSAYNWEN